MCTVHYARHAVPTILQDRCIRFHIQIGILIRDFKNRFDCGPWIPVRAPSSTVVWKITMALRLHCAFASMYHTIIACVEYTHHLHLSSSEPNPSAQRYRPLLKFNTLWHRHPRRERSSTAGIQNLLRCLTDKIRWYGRRH